MIEDDLEFFAEVNAFIDSLPEDSDRVQRIAGSLPDHFQDVLRKREARRSVEKSPVLAMPTPRAWSWSAIAASTAIAAALIGMVLIFLTADSEDPHPPRPVARERSSSGELEFVVTIQPDGKLPEIVAQPRLVETDGAVGPGREVELPTVVASAEDVLPVEDVGSWFLKRPVAVVPPENLESDWATGAIDRFVLAALEARGIAPVADADRLPLLRRLSYDLTGLPPSPELIEHFLLNPSPAAYGSVVEELMATWQFGEYWAGRWLELVEYDPSRQQAWRYREYVIAALNEDKPFDRFLTEQLAGDLMELAAIDERAEARVGTGFLAVSGGGGADALVDRVSGIFMGMDAAFARSGDGQKYPLSQHGCQAMAGIFASTRLADDLELRLDSARFPPANQVEDERVQAESKRLRGLIASGERRLGRAFERGDVERARRLRAEVSNLVSDLMILERGARDQVVSSGATYAGAQDRRRMQASAGVARGVPTELAESVTQPEVARGRSGRLELAEWLVDPDHPLTARVFVNHVWRELFGNGLVRASGEMGLPGHVPSHPELLDYLAARFVEEGWSMKSLVRQMVSSRVYQLSGAESAEGLAADAGNRWLWRHSPRGLRVGERRDAVISVAGWLSRTGEAEGRLFARHEFGAIAGLEDEHAYRSIYTDGAGRVDEELVFEAAVAASARLVESPDGLGVEGKVRDVFIATLGRAPSSEESDWAIGVIGRAGSLESGGVLGSARRPDRMGERAGYLEGLLPRVTVRVEDDEQDGEGVVPWAMLYHALMMSEGFGTVR